MKRFQERIHRPTPEKSDDDGWLLAIGLGALALIVLILALTFGI